MILTRHHSFSCSAFSVSALHSGHKMGENLLPGSALSDVRKCLSDGRTVLPCPIVLLDPARILWRRVVRSQAGLHRSGSHCLRAAYTFSSARLFLVLVNGYSLLRSDYTALLCSLTQLNERHTRLAWCC